MNAYDKIRAVLLHSQLPLSTGIGADALAALAELERAAKGLPAIVESAYREGQRSVGTTFERTWENSATLKLIQERTK